MAVIGLLSSFALDTTDTPDNLIDIHEALITEISFSETAIQNVDPLTISTSALDAAQLTKAYYQEVHSSGGVAPYTWDISVGALPAGLSIAAGTGIITGTPTTAGTTNFTVRVTDNLASTATLATSITVNAAGGAPGFASSLIRAA